MAVDDPAPASGAAPAEPSAGAGAPAVPDPRDAELAELRTYYQRINPVLEAYQDDFNAIVEDEDYREFVRSSRKSYQQMRDEAEKARQNELPPEHRRLLDEIDNRLKPALEEVSVLRKDRETRAARETAEAKRASEEFAKRETEFANRLVAEQKISTEEVMDVARFAKQLHDESVAKGEPRFVGIEEVYKRLYGRAEAKAATAVPKSLRAKSGATGVPGASKPAEPGPIDVSKPGGFTGEMLKRLNAQRKTG
jgi:hypothetical protein